MGSAASASDSKELFAWLEVVGIVFPSFATDDEPLEPKDRVGEVRPALYELWEYQLWETQSTSNTEYFACHHG